MRWKLQFFGVLSLAILINLVADYQLENCLAAEIDKNIVHVNARLVPVLVRVIDTNGNPILDLHREDFDIYDNEERMNIQYFSEEVLQPDTNLRTDQQALRQIPTLELSYIPRRSFLVLLGRGGITDQFNAIDDLIAFINDRLLPQDVVAVMAYNRASEFTTDHQRVISILNRYKNLRGKIEIFLWKQRQGNSLSSIYGINIPPQIQKYIDQVFNAETDHLDSSVDTAAQIGSTHRKFNFGKDNKPAVDKSNEYLDGISMPEEFSQDRVDGSIRIDSVNPFDVMRLRALTTLPFNEFISNCRMTEKDLESIFSAINYLRYMEEPKYILFFSDQGLYLPRIEGERGIISLASEARVTIHTFQTGGTTSQFNQALSIMSPAQRARWNAPTILQDDRDGMLALSSLAQIADSTGGVATIHKDIKPALKQLDEMTRSCYLIGYDPGLIQWNGAFRKIQIKVKHKNARVLHRRGYFAYETPKPFDAAEFLAYSRIASAATVQDEITDLRFKSTLIESKDTSGMSTINISLNIDLSSIQLTTSDNLMKDTIFIANFYRSTDKKKEGNTWNRLDIILDQNDYLQAKEKGLQISVRLPLKISKSRIMSCIYDAGSGKVGTQLVHN